MNRRRLTPCLLLGFALLALITANLFTNPTLALAAPPVERAWVRASEIGRYQFTTNVEQTTAPLPLLVNAGLSPKTDRLYIEGSVDESAEILHLNIWQEGGSSLLGSGSIEMMVQDGVSLGRSNGGAWQQVDNASHLFAPNNDPLAFLNAAINLHEDSTSARDGVTVYNFDIDGIRYSNYMRQALQDEMVARGEIFPEMTIQMPRHYAQMSGSGQIWLDEGGLPLRQIVDLSFPPDEREQIDAVITTDFNGWDDADLLTTWRFEIGDWFGQGAAQIGSQASTIGVQGSVLISATLLSVVMVTRPGSKRVYRLVSASFVLTMLVQPLLQGGVAHASSQLSQRRQAAAGDENSAGEHATAMENDMQRGIRALANSAVDPQDESIVIFDDGNDADGDGLTDVQETDYVGTDPLNPDSDGDGLDDGTEIHQIGTLPDSADSDGDGLTDKLEVDGFFYGQQWYLDPMDSDSSGDGEPDGFGCEIVSNALNCLDTDGDNTPDVFDADNDNDLVPDRVDSSSQTMVGSTVSGLDDQTFEFDITGTAANETVFVDVQLRPTNPDHLWYSLSVLDWPSNDRDGQIQRVFDSVYGNSGRSANGDMRLVPMLEVELSGTPLPLPLTTPATSVSYGTTFSGTIDFEQVGSDVFLATNWFNNGASYDVALYDTTCRDRTEDDSATVTYFGVADGQQRILNNTTLTSDIADGAHAVVLSSGGQEACSTIPNVVNGAYANQMVDSAALAAYGISAREKDANTVLLYAPLTLVYDREENSPVAFGARLFYDMISADFGSAQQARLIWLLNVKTDQCLPMPDDFDPDPETTGADDEAEAVKVAAWCGDNANWIEEGPSVMHSWYDDWYVTSLNVQRNLDFKTAVVYQNPAYTAGQSDYVAGGFNDDALWLLTQGLDRSYMIGRAADNSTNRDLDIDDVAARWDSGSNGAASAAQRFDLPADAFSVDRYDFDDVTGLGTVAQQNAYATLESVFGGTSITDPTLLFLRENHVRSLSLDFSADITSRAGRTAGAIQGNSVVISADSAAAPATVFASMNWVPYRNLGSWEPYPLEEYYADKGADIESVLASEYSGDELEGAAVLAKLFYVAMFVGFTNIVEIDDLAADLPARLSDAEMNAFLYEDPDLTIGDAVISSVSTSWSLFKGIVGSSFFNVDSNGNRKLGGLLGPPNLVGDVQAHVAAGNTLVGEASGEPLDLDAVAFISRTARIQSLERLAGLSDSLGFGATAVGVAATVFGLMAAGISTVSEKLADIINMTSKVLSVISKGMRVASLAIKLYVQLQLNSFKHLLAKGVQFSKSSVIFLVVGLVISVGLFIYEAVASDLQPGSLALNQLFVDLVASIVVAVILFAIALIPVIGQLIAAIIAVIDAIITTICSLVNDEGEGNGATKARKYLCGGISGLLEMLVSWTLYDQSPLIDLDKSDRLNMTNFAFGFTDPSSGYSSGNHMVVSAEVESGLYKNRFDSEEDVSLFAVHRWMFNENNSKRTTFEYLLAETEAEVHDSLNEGDISDQWLELPADTTNFFAPDADFYLTRTVSITLNEALRPGINYDEIELYLAEGQAYMVQECTIPFTCWLREDKASNHLDVGAMLVFDIFPASVTDFRQLAQIVGSNSYQLAWDSDFPALQDADGDGLRSRDVGGNDPNDANPDIDGDSLSDFYEIHNSNTDPLDPDSDNDGLCDDQELDFNTDPTRADSDGDGLLDGEEVFHHDRCDADGDTVTDEYVGGWEIVYGYSGNTALKTWVTSDPNSPDPDQDQYTDVQERLYNLHPRVPSSGDLLNIDAVVEDTIVQPGTTIDYEVGLENGLNSSFALGLLDVEFSAEIQAATLPPAVFNIAPQQSEQSSGSVTLRGDLSSQVVTMTNQADALIISPLTAVGGRSFWLQFEDAPTGGAQTFTDSSLNQFNVSCPNASGCPTLGSAGYRLNGVNFSAASQDINVDATISELGLDSNGFTLDFWVLHRTGTIAFPLLSDEFIVMLSNGAVTVRNAADTQTIITSPGIPRDRWQRITWRYEPSNHAHTLFLNGAQIQTSTFDMSSILAAAAQDTMSLEYSGFSVLQFDDYSIYPFPLGDADIANVGADRVFYLRGGHNFGGSGSTIRDNSVFANTVTCLESDGCPDATAQGYIDNGIDFSPETSADFSVLRTNAAQLDLSENNGHFSVSAWVNSKSGTPVATGWLLGLGDPTLTAEQYLWPSLRVEPSNQQLEITIGIRDEVGRRCHYRTGKITGDGYDASKWYHVAYSFDGNRFTLFVNGEPIAGEHNINSTSVDNGNCDGITPRSETQFHLGGAGKYNPAAGGFDAFYSGSMFSGNVDEVQIFNYALSAEQLQDIYWDEAPILDLRFDEPPSSTSFDDRSLNDHLVTCSGAACPIAGVQGKDLLAVQFDTSDNINLPASDELSLIQSSFTAAAWVNANSTSNTLFRTPGSATGSEFLVFGTLPSGGFGVPYMEIGGSFYQGMTATISADSWHHIAYRYDYDETNNNGDITFFVDSAMVGTYTNAAPATGSGQPLNLLAATDKVDRFQVFRGALTDAAITRLYLQAPLLNLHLDQAYGVATVNGVEDTDLPTICSGCQSGVKGRVNHAFDLTANNDGLLIADPAGLFDLTTFSVGGWFRPIQQHSGFQALLAKEDTSADFDRNFGLHILPNSMNVNATVQLADCSTFAGGSSSAPLVQGLWNHVMLTFDGAELAIYVNGSRDTGFAVPSVCTDSDNIIIGSNANLLENFIGDADEVVLYGSVLSAENIRDIFDLQTSWYDVAIEHRVTVDADLPTLTFNPAVGNFRDVAVVLPIIAEDITSDVELVEYRINGSSWTAATQDDEAWLFTFMPTGSGAYSVNLRATDQAGNVGVFNRVLNVDGSGPILGAFNIEGNTSIGVQRNEATDSWDVELSGSVTTAGSPLNYVTVDLFDSLGTRATDRLTATVNAGVWSATAAFGIRPNDTYTVSVQAVDNAGNVTGRTALANINGTAPVATVFGGSAGILYSGQSIFGTVVETNTVQAGVARLDVAYEPLGIHDLSSAAVVTDGLVAHLTLNELIVPGSGDTLVFSDSSGNGHAGICSSCPTTGERGYLGSAPRFDGSTQWVAGSSALSELSGGGFTLAAWFTPLSGGSDDLQTVAKLTDGATSYLLQYRKSTERVSLTVGGLTVTSLDSFAEDSWHHVAVTIGGAGATQLYVNGVPEGMFTTSTPGAATEFELGRTGNSNGYFAGLIDDLVIYDRELTSAEILQQLIGHSPAVQLRFDDAQFRAGEEIKDSARGFFGDSTFVSNNPAPFRPAIGAVGGGALPLDGVSQYVSVPARFALDMSDGTFTQMAWVHPQNSTAPLFGSTALTAAQSHPFATIINGTQLTVGFGDGTALRSYTTSSILTQNAWNFVVISFDGTSYRIYVNGQLADTTSSLSAFTPAPTASFVVGHDGGSDYFEGMIDEVVVYPFTVSAETIAQRYLQGWQAATIVSRDVGDPTASWNQQVPSILNGAYQIRLRTHDTLGNISNDFRGNGVWEGVIDNEQTAPTSVTLQRVEATAGSLLIVVAVALLLVGISFGRKRHGRRLRTK